MVKCSMSAPPVVSIVWYRKNVPVGIVQFVDERVCVVSVNITIVVGEGEKQTCIDAELFNISTSSGWQILMFFEVVQTTGTILVQKQQI